MTITVTEGSLAAIVYLGPLFVDLDQVDGLGEHLGGVRNHLDGLDAARQRLDDAVTRRDDLAAAAESRVREALPRPLVFAM